MAYAVKWKALLSVNCTPLPCVVAKFYNNETHSVSIHADLSAIHASANEQFTQRPVLQFTSYNILFTADTSAFTDDVIISLWIPTPQYGLPSATIHTYDAACDEDLPSNACST